MKKGMSAILFDDVTIEDSIEAAAKIGYDGIELRTTKPGHLTPDTTEEKFDGIKRLIGEKGLEVPCIACFTGKYYKKNDAECEEQLQELKRYVEFARQLDCPALRQWAGTKPSADATEADWERAAHWVGWSGLQALMPPPVRLLRLTEKSVNTPLHRFPEDHY